MEFKYDFYQRGRISFWGLILGGFLFFSAIYLLFEKDYSGTRLEILYIVLGLNILIRSAGYKAEALFGKKLVEVTNMGMHFKFNTLRKGHFFSRNEVNHLDIWPGKIRIDAKGKNKSIDVTELSPQLRHDLLMAVISFARENKINHKKHGYLEHYQ